MLAKFGIGAGEVTRSTASLSPGERTRAVLALLMANGTNCLVLDEPTNHLDLPAIEQLETALESFRGTVLLVTHDRSLLDHVRLTRQIRLEAGRVIDDRSWPERGWRRQCRERQRANVRPVQPREQAKRSGAQSDHQASEAALGGVDAFADDRLDGVGGQLHGDVHLRRSALRSFDSTWSAPRSFDGGLPMPMRTRT